MNRFKGITPERRARIEARVAQWREGYDGPIATPKPKVKKRVVFRDGKHYLVTEG